MTSNPFLNEYGYGAVDIQSRIDMVKRFSIEQCQVALNVSGLQKTVQKAIHSQIRKLAKANA